MHRQVALYGVRVFSSPVNVPVDQAADGLCILRTLRKPAGCVDYASGGVS